MPLPVHMAKSFLQTFLLMRMRPDGNGIYRAEMIEKIIAKYANKMRVSTRKTMALNFLPILVAHVIYYRFTKAFLINLANG